MAPILEIEGLTKRFGPVLALDRLTLEMGDGEAVGFLGPNGAGKTTTIRLLLDLIHPTEGCARIGGFDCHRENLEARRLVGYLPGEMPTYPELSGYDYLGYLGRLNASPPRPRVLDALLARFDLGPAQLSRPMRDLSHGTKRKLGIVQALMGEPRIAILDEPTSGLDPLMIEAFAEVVQGLRRGGRTAVFLSSHVLSEVEKTCDRVAIVRDGGLMAVRTIAELSTSLPRRVTIRFASEEGAERFRRTAKGSEPSLAAAGVRSGPSMTISQAGAGSEEDSSDLRAVVLDVVGPLGPLLDRLAGAPIADLDVRAPSLEDYVLGLYRTGDNAERRTQNVELNVELEERGADHARPSGQRDRCGAGLQARDERAADHGCAGGRRTTLPALVGRSAARGRRLFLSAAAILAAFQILLVVIASTFQETRSFNLLTALIPMGVQQSLGPGALMLASFAGMVTFGYFHPIVVLAVVQLGIFAATEPAGEVEWGLFDLELARPVRRRTIVTRTLLVAMGATALVAGAMMGGTWAGLAMMAPAGAPWPMPERVVSLAAHLLLLAWTFAAAGLAAAGWARRRGAAFGAVAAVTVVLYLVNFVADAWPKLSRLRPWTPFHYFPGLAVSNGTAPVVRDLATLAAVAVALSAVGYWRFERRDL